MKLNKVKVKIFEARACMNHTEVSAAAGITVNGFLRALNGGGIHPKTAGKVAKALNCDVLDIIDEESI